MAAFRLRLCGIGGKAYGAMEQDIDGDARMIRIAAFLFAHCRQGLWSCGA
ncbi:hypothetical protein [Adlercreutzia sp. ZJ138]|nr:hypothetical protein [Adlercreutzia sp. ZJ138]